MRKKYNFKNIFILLIVSYVFFIAGNSILSLTNPDEVFYAQTAKEMIKHKTWLVPYLFDQPQFEKPILTYWLLRIVFMLFGASSFGARFFPAFFAMLGVIVVYFLSLFAYNDEKKAFICALVLASGGFYIGLARTVFTDMIFSIFILLSLASFFRGYIEKDKKKAGILLFFAFSGLAVLTKGPLGFLIPLLVVLLFLGIRRELKLLFSRYFFWGFLLFLVIAVPWYVFMLKKFGNSFIQEFFYNDHIRRIFEAEHPENDRWYFYPLTMIFCMVPWSIYVAVSLFSFVKRLKEKQTLAINLFLACWIIVVFVVFQIAHSKLTSYIFPLFPALAMITGDFICNAIKVNKQRTAQILAFITWFALLFLPIAVLINSIIYSKYIPSKAPVYNFIFVYIVVLVIMLLFILKKKFFVNIYLLAFQVPLILFFALFSHKYFDDYVSSKNVCDYLLKNYKVENTILCAKLFVRGVRYYTDMNVAVINAGGADFFSSHPLPYFDTDDKVTVFLKSQPTTYCILSKSSLTDITRVASNNKFNIDILKTIGNAYIVKISILSLKGAS